MIRVTCPCACVWRVGYTLAGKQIPCPICGRIVTVPGKVRKTGGKKTDGKKTGGKKTDGKKASGKKTGGKKAPPKAGKSHPALIWYIQTADGELGPIHIVQIAKAAWQGKINRNTRLRRTGSDEIVAAGDLEGIFPDEPAAKSKKPAAAGGVSDELTDYLSGLAEQATKGDAPAAEGEFSGSLGALLDAQRSVTAEPVEEDEKAPRKKAPPEPEKKAPKASGRPKADLKALADALSAEEPKEEHLAKPAGKAKTKPKSKKKAPRKHPTAKTGAGAKARAKPAEAGKKPGGKGPAAGGKPKPPPKSQTRRGGKPTSKAAARRAALEALADTLSGEEKPGLDQIEAAGVVETQVYEQPAADDVAEAESAGESRLEELQKVPSDGSAAMARARAHWDRLTGLALSPEFFAKTSTIILGAAMLLTIVLPWGVKDKAFVMSWEILQEAEAGPVLLLVGTWVVGLAVVLAGVLLGRLTLSVSALALSAVALVMVLLSGEGMLKLAPWLETVQEVVRKLMLAGAGLLLMIQMAATRLRLRGVDSVAARLAQRLGGGGMALLAGTAVVLLILDYTALEQGPRKDLFFDFLFFLMLWICLLVTGVLADLQTLLRAGSRTFGKVSLWLGYAAVVATVAYVIGRVAQKMGPLGPAMSGVNVCLLVAGPWWLGKFALEATVRGLTERLAASEGTEQSSSNA